MKNIRAVLFDMDGLLLDSESLNMRSAAQVAQEYGIDLDIGKLARTVCGVQRQCAVQAYASVLPKDVDAEAFYNRKNELRAEGIARGEMVAMKGAEDLLKWLNDHGIVCVLASSTSLPAAKPLLINTGLWDYLHHHVTGDDVSRSKPDPEIFLKAAKAAGFAPGECLVLEDSFNGIRSGRDAGCIVGMVPDCLPYSEQCAPYCDVVFDDLTAVIPWLEN